MAGLFIPGSNKEIQLLDRCSLNHIFNLRNCFELQQNPLFHWLETETLLYTHVKLEQQSKIFENLYEKNTLLIYCTEPKIVAMVFICTNSENPITCTTLQIEDTMKIFKLPDAYRNDQVIYAYDKVIKRNFIDLPAPCLNSTSDLIFSGDWSSDLSNQFSFRGMMYKVPDQFIGEQNPQGFSSLTLDVDYIDPTPVIGNVIFSENNNPPWKFEAHLKTKK